MSWEESNVPHARTYKAKGEIYSFSAGLEVSKDT